MDEFTFKTASGKLEVIAPVLQEMDIPSLKPYHSPESPPEGSFRITFGRCALHTQGHTVNNPVLSRQMPENVLWINADKAAELGIADGDRVTVSANGYSGQIKAYVTDYMHPEAVFMVHGFGHTLRPETRAYGKGVADNKLMPGGLDREDKAGGGIAMQEHFVKVAKA
jgi:thiosulfate reductase/polysulfide reductase chain A